MSTEAIRYKNIYGRTCFSSRSDFAGSLAEIGADGVVLRDIGLELTIPFQEIDWLISVLKDVKATRAKQNG